MHNFPALKALTIDNICNATVIGDTSWFKTADMSQFPKLLVRKDVIETLGKSHYIASLDEAVEHSHKVQGVDLDGKPFLRTKWIKHFLHRQYPENFGRRGDIAVKRLRTKKIGNKRFDPVPYSAADINQYINNLRIDGKGDKFVWYVAKDNLGLYHLYIDDISCVSNVVAVSRGIGEIVDISKIDAKSLKIHDISVCCPAISQDITGGVHIGMVAFGQNPYGDPGDNLLVCISNSPFFGWKKKLGLCASAALFAHDLGFEILHASAVQDPVTKKVILYIAVGSGGKTEMGQTGPDELYFSGTKGVQTFKMSETGKRKPLRIADDLALIRVIKGKVYVCNAENGILHRPEDQDDEIVRYLKNQSDYVVVDNFDVVNGEIDFTCMKCLCGKISDNSRVLFSNSQLEPGSYVENSTENMIPVDAVVLGDIFPPAFNKDTMTLDRSVPNKHPITRYNVPLFTRSYCANARITTQSIADKGDRNELRDEGPGTIVSFIVQRPGKFIADQLNVFRHIDIKQTSLFGISQRHPAHTVAFGMYDVGYMFRDLYLRGILDQVVYESAPTGVCCFVPQFKEGQVPEYFRVPASAMAVGYQRERLLTLNGVETLEIDYEGNFQSLRFLPDQLEL